MLYMSTQRTDIHSPINMDPASYEYVVALDTVRSALGPGRTLEGQAWAHSILAKLNTSETRAHKNTNAQCDHCGAWLRYAAIMHHLPTDDYILVGEQCLDNRFSLSSKAEFDALREAAALDRQCEAIKEACFEIILSLTGNTSPEVIDLLNDRKGENDPEALSYIAKDIRNRFWSTGRLSDKQVAFVTRLLAEAQPKPQTTTEGDECLVEAPTGRYEVSGVVLAAYFKEYDNGFGRMVMTVLAEGPDGNFKVWGSIPAAISPVKGDRVTFTATFEPKAGDPTFAFFKRPSKATCTEPAEV